jgi:hypothetical protein
VHGNLLHKSLVHSWCLVIARQKGKAKERPKDKHPAGTKKKEKASPSRGSKLSHPQPL